nr:immunoglobulin light chain junction region [Macaca mulatta]
CQVWDMSSDHGLF